MDRYRIGDWFKWDGSSYILIEGSNTGGEVTIVGKYSGLIIFHPIPVDDIFNITKEEMEQMPHFNEFERVRCASKL